MARGSGWLSKSYASVLWGSRRWEDIYKVRGYFPGTIGDADREINQFISHRHPMRARLWPEYRGFVPLLRLPGAERPIGGEYDRESTQAACPRSSGDCSRN